MLTLSVKDVKIFTWRSGDVEVREVTGDEPGGAHRSAGGLAFPWGAGMAYDGG